MLMGAATAADATEAAEKNVRIEAIIFAVTDLLCGNKKLK